jgi:hypothetical protein
MMMNLGVTRGQPSPALAGEGGVRSTPGEGGGFRPQRFLVEAPSSVMLRMTPSPASAGEGKHTTTDAYP